MARHLTRRVPQALASVPPALRRGFARPPPSRAMAFSPFGDALRDEPDPRPSHGGRGAARVRRAG